MTETKITIRVPEDLYQKAKEKARQEDITLSQVLRRCLRNWLEEDPSEPVKEEKV
jgi:predicted HicB family RNase H-like nuclease